MFCTRHLKFSYTFLCRINKHPNSLVLFFSTIKLCSSTVIQKATHSSGCGSGCALQVNICFEVCVLYVLFNPISLYCALIIANCHKAALLKSRCRFIFRFIMSKPEATATRKSSLRQHKEEALRGTRLKKGTCPLLGAIMNHYASTIAAYKAKQY